MRVEHQNPTLIDLREVSRRTCLGKTALYEVIKRGELRPAKIGRKTVFSDIEVNDWIAARLAERDRA